MVEARVMLSCPLYHTIPHDDLAPPECTMENVEGSGLAYEA